MADSLLVVFSREGEPELSQICADGDVALAAALGMLMRQDALRVGDSVTATAYRAPNLIDRGIA